MNITRVVSWFSCGITSAVAAKLALEKYGDKYPVEIVYFYLKNEHPDNLRFLKDCEKWLQHPITTIEHEKYHSDIYEVYDAFEYVAGIYGAKCSQVLKKQQREKFEDLEHDLQIFGYDAQEKKRVKRFKLENPLVNVEFILYDRAITKNQCAVEIINAGIELPEMYKLGYKNNNCIGCVKGAKGYWNKIRKDFPDIFEKMSQYEHKYNVRLNMITEKGVTRRIFLSELPEDAGNYESEIPIACGFSCGDGSKGE